jgi:hypothetical protein
MGRKSSAKGQRLPGDAAREAPEKKGKGSLFLIIAMVVAVGAGAYLIWGQGPTAAETEAAAQQAKSAAEDKPDPAEMAKIEANAKAVAALGPHTQASYPPVPFQDFAPPRPVPTVNAAFHFAAEHPEVLSYIPCFCGCQHMGHKGNEDCFVKSRNANGDVTEWEPHGVECAVCIDVATRARQMTASGASVEQIRTAVEKEFKTNMASETPTPHASH